MDEPDEQPDTPIRTTAKKKPPPKGGLIGPLFSWELLRLARKGQDARGRFILAVALFFVLTAFALIWFHDRSPIDVFLGESQLLSIQQTAQFGESFSLTFVLGQLGVLVLLTPAYAAGGIAEEKDKKTFVFLLVSDLSEREIVFGKFLGRTFFLLGILFAGLPILAITQLHGGVSPAFLVLSYVITGTTVVLLSAVGAYAAASAETFRGGLFRAYAITAIIVLTGCGIYPLLSPFGVLSVLFTMEGSATGNEVVYWLLAVGYPIAQLVLAGVGVWMAVRAVRRLRSKLTSKTPKPPPWVKDRYRDEDREKARQERLKAELAEAKRLEAERQMALLAEPLVLEIDSAPAEPTVTADGRMKARRIPVAAVTAPPKPKAKVPEPPQPEERRWDSSDDRKSERRRNYRDPGMHADAAPARPKIGGDDPFYWKETHTTGLARTSDDDAMKTMMYLVGGVLGLILLFFLMISIIALVTDQGGQRTASVAKWLMLTAGSAGVFAQLLQVGLASTAAISRERQRLTLESLLTIPVPRRAILWPKWLHSLLRGWWWGGPAAVVMLLAFLATDAPVVAAPTLVYFLALIPFATSYGIWLSIRCQAVNRAVMWFLPVAGVLVVVPIVIAAATTAALWLPLAAVSFLVSTILIVGTVLFWRWSVTAFDHETVLGQGKG